MSINLIKCTIDDNDTVIVSLRFLGIFFHNIQYSLNFIVSSVVLMSTSLIIVILIKFVVDYVNHFKIALVAVASIIKETKTSALSLFHHQNYCAICCFCEYVKRFILVSAMLWAKCPASLCALGKEMLTYHIY